jgi:hypothetical protein
MMLIYTPTDNPRSTEELAAEMPRWGSYTQSLIDGGLMVSGDALQGVDVATTVRERGGETQVTDGPFAETKEVLGGYYVLDAPDLDTVLDYASRVPSVGYGSVEIRPVLEMSGAGQEAPQAQAQA